MSHAPNDVCGVVAQVNVSIMVKINGIVSDAAGHEQRHANVSRKTAFQTEWVDVFTASKQQQVFELLPEKTTSVTASCGKVKSQGSQGINDSKTTHVLAINGFYANNAQNNFRWNPIPLLGQAEHCLVTRPKLTAS
jgi:hypothetical protein